MTAARAAATQPDFSIAMDHVAQAFEALAALILIVGVLWSAALTTTTWRRARSCGRAYATLRQTFGGTLLVALEVLVAADLIRTVAVAPSLDNVLGLGLIVVIRTFLSFSLETEIEGVPPWRRAMTSGAAVVSHAAQSASGNRPAEHPPPGEGRH
jgi:uncharacterized membrane protein